jgi:hypothetical protein
MVRLVIEQQSACVYQRPLLHRRPDHHPVALPTCGLEYAQMRTVLRLTLASHHTSRRRHCVHCWRRRACATVPCVVITDADVFSPGLAGDTSDTTHCC